MHVCACTYCCVFESGTWISNLLFGQKFQSVVGDVTILAKRMANVTFTEPFLPSELYRVVRVEPDSKQWVLTKPFSRKVWLLIVATYIYTCITVWYLEREQNPEIHGSWKEQLGATLWLIFCTIFFAHGENLTKYPFLFSWKFVSQRETLLYLNTLEFISSIT